MRWRGVATLFAMCAGGCLFVVGEGAPLRLAAQSQPPPASAPAAAEPASFGIGRPATSSEIAPWDIDVRPDGAGLPAGRATPDEGAPLYAARCAACHGRTGREGPADILVGRLPSDGFPFGRDPGIPKTIGNYWPYATTLFDYVRRAMPADAPGSLTDDEVYRLTAYLLFLNQLIPADAVIDAASLPRVMMPSRDRFVADPRGGPGGSLGVAPPR